MIDNKKIEQLGCVLIKGFLDPTTVATISQYFENKITVGEWKEVVEKNIESETTKFFYYAEPLVEVVLKTSRALVEEAVGKELFPTYSYARIYQPGEELKPHIDRPACEYSVTVNVAHKGAASPIYMQYKDNPVEHYILASGDAVVYKGCEVRHWREPLQKDQLNVQFMLHYVDKHGANAAHRFDKRAALGLPCVLEG
jgi:hypothetical protein